LSKASQVILALGTNLGQRRANLQLALDTLGEVLTIEAVSPIYETEPWGFTDQPDFFNACLLGLTKLSPHDLLDTCKSIEQRLGRQAGSKWGPRLIDIDMIFYGQLILDNGKLKIPHPQLDQRAFVLAPLADIAPDWSHPESNQSVADLLENVDESTVRRLPRSEYSLRRPINLAWGHKTYVMGILNVTPDSFSGDGLVKRDRWIQQAVAKSIDLVDDGADILDIGGQSTRPGGVPVSVDEELARIMPVLQELRNQIDVPISVDTYRAEIASAALEAGADWVNDVWGLRMDSQMAGVVAAKGCPVVIMHNRSKPKNVEQEKMLGGRYVGIEYDDLIGDIKRELLASINLALEAGIRPEKIIVDPGIGFGKTVNQNLELIKNLSQLRSLGYPLLVGPSRKSFIGYTLDLAPDERVEGTAATVAISIERGADIVRVHDVREMSRVAKMADAILR